MKPFPTYVPTNPILPNLAGRFPVIDNSPLLQITQHSTTGYHTMQAISNTLSSLVLTIRAFLSWISLTWRTVRSPSFLLLEPKMLGEEECWQEECLVGVAYSLYRRMFITAAAAATNSMKRWGVGFWVACELMVVLKELDLRGRG